MKTKFLKKVITKKKLISIIAIVMLASSFLGYAELPLRGIEKHSKQRALAQEQAASQRRRQVESDGEDLSIIEAARLRAAQAELDVARVRYRLAAWMAAARAAAQQREETQSDREHIAAEWEAPARDIQEREATVEPEIDLTGRM